MESMPALLGPETCPDVDPILCLPAYKLLLATRVFEEGVLLPLLSVADLQCMFDINKPKAQKLFDVFHEPAAKLVNAYEVLSVAIFTASEDSAFTIARRLMLLFDADQDLKLDEAEFCTLLRSLLRGLIRTTTGPGYTPPPDSTLDAQIALVLNDVSPPPRGGVGGATQREVPLEAWYRLVERHSAVIERIHRQMDLAKVRSRKAEAAARHAALQQRAAAAAKAAHTPGAASHTLGATLGTRSRFRAAVKAVATALAPRKVATIDHTDVLELLEIFDELDSDGDGTVQHYEFVKKLQYALGSARADKIFSAMDANLSKELSFMEMAAGCFPKVELSDLQEAIVAASQHVALRHKRVRLVKLLLSPEQRANILEIFEQLVPTGQTAIRLVPLCKAMGHVVHTEADELHSFLVDNRLVPSPDALINAEEFLKIYVQLIQHDTELIRYCISVDNQRREEEAAAAAQQRAMAATATPRARSMGGANTITTTTTTVSSPISSPRHQHHHHHALLSPRRPAGGGGAPKTPRTPGPRQRRNPRTPRSIIDVLDRYRDSQPILINRVKRTNTNESD